MFRNSLLGGTSLTRIVDGEYRSPNVCFIDDDKELVGDAEIETEADGEDEGPEDGDGEESDGESDDGVEDGEGDGESQEDDEGQEQVAAPPKRKGASEVIRENKRSRQEAERKAEALERRVEAAERRAEAAERQQAERRQTESKEARDARLALMSPEERFEELRKEDQEAHTRDLNTVKFQIWDSTDRSEFQSLVREDPLVAKVQDKVEAEYQKYASAGNPVKRELIANQFIAKLMRERQKTAGSRQRKRGEESVRRETVKPRQARSDAAPQRSRRGQEDTPEARRRRLEGVILN